MTIKNLIEQLPTMGEREREIQVRYFMDNIASSITKNTIRQFQETWDGSRGYDEFKVALDKEIIVCLKLEVSAIGTIARGIEGLKPLTLDTELNGALIAG